MSLSAILTSYNYAHYLPRALDGIINQTSPPSELIVFDDASTDNSVKIIKQYQTRHKFIKFYQNPVNIGVIATANKAMDLARGDYLVLCAADDEMLPPFFEKSVSLLERYPQAGLCFSKFCLFYEDEEKTSLFGKNLAKEESFFHPGELVQILRRKDIRIGGQHAIFRRSYLPKTTPLLPQLGPMSDWFLIMTLAFRHGLCFIPEELTKMRIHSKAYSQVYAKDYKFYQQAFGKFASILKTEPFQDVRPAFIQSGISFQLGVGIIPPLFLKHREFINFRILFHLGIILLKTIKHKLKKIR